VTAQSTLLNRTMHLPTGPATRSSSSQGVLMLSDQGGLSDALARLPAQPLAALRVLELVEQPDASAAEMARLIETDPSLSARVIRLANAPYYGVGRRVSSASRAVVLLGFSTVRALAVSAACSLIAENGRQGPPGYWAHSIATASAASVVARQAGLPPGDAFSAGLLHDLGSALLFRQDATAYASVLARSATVGTLRAERESFGQTHPETGAAVLDAWRFPDEFVRAVADHHAPPASIRDPLGRAVAAGEAVAEQVGAPSPPVRGPLGPGAEPTADIDEALWAAGVSVPAGRMIALARREVSALAAFLHPGS
jgi:putative nucleotidyltransferase with HDIG domain